MNILSRSVAYSLGRTVLALQPTGNAGTYLRAVQEAFPNSANVRYIPFSSPFPAMGIFTEGTSTVCQSYGVSDLAGGTATFFTSWQPAFVSPTAWTNPSFLALANRMRALLNTVSLSPGDRLILVGHSWGGAAAQVLAAQLAWSGVSRDIQCLTFGSPKIGNSGLVQLLRAATCLRLMTSTDAVADSPPTISEAPVLYASTPFLLSLVYSQYMNGPGGVEVAQDGTATARPSPSSVSWGVVDNLYAAASGSLGPFAPSHWMGAYLSAMSSWRAPSAGDTLVEAPTPPVPSAITRAEWQLNADMIEGKLGATEGLNVAYIPPVYVARAQIVGSHPRTYIVVQGADLICTCATKSEAHTIAKALNRLYRRLLEDSQSLSKTAFNDAINYFLLAAANPASGITPTLNVTT